MRISEFKPDFDDVLIRPKRSMATSRKDVDLQRTFKHIFKYRSVVPIINANMDTVGSFKMADAMANNLMLGSVHKFYKMEELVEYYGHAHLEEGLEHRGMTFYTMGIKDDDLDKFSDLNIKCYNLGCPIETICLDVANGYTKIFEHVVKVLRGKYPHKVIMAGNVATPEVTESLILAGADIVKVGIGPGSVCTTRVKTGVGYPQLSAIAECADAAHGLNRYICADGGCRTPGDICKAFCAGADIVMLGGMLAGCEECDGDWEYDYRTYTYWLKYYGMSSKDAADKYHGGVAEHRTAEGKAVMIQCKGPVVNTLKDIEGGLRSCGSYIGASRIKDFPKCASFVRTGVQENRVFNEL